ncbi:MAG: oxygen-independent coproporphyrinogen III oxidase [Opitutaceae bacterium]
MISPQDLGSATPTSTFPSPGSTLDLDLIRKYSGPAPRYTSYPPATQFHAQFSNADIEATIVDDNRADAGPISLYFHLPFCETLCWYCGCNTVITRQHGAADGYLDSLARELDLVVAKMERTRPVTQLHLGGGTPTFLSADQLLRLADLVKSRFVFASDAEISAEIDPRRLTGEQVAALRSLGMNRASLGVQDTDAAVQRAINRIQPQEINRRAVDWLRAAGVDSINLDLIYGLPLQTPDTFDRTLDDILSLEPDRLSVFSYAHVPWMKPAQKIFEHRNQLPVPEGKLAMFALAHERLTEAGFVDVGLDHFARPTDELAIALREGTLHRNFQGYTTRAGASLYSFGVSSISQTANTYRQNHKTLGAWRDALARSEYPVEKFLRLSDEDIRRRELIMSLMCRRELNFADLGRRLQVDIPAQYATEIASLTDLEADGLVTVNSQGVTVTPRGAPLLRVVASRFDATFQAAARRHAQAV